MCSGSTAKRKTGLLSVHNDRGSFGKALPKVRRSLHALRLAGMTGFSTHCKRAPLKSGAFLHDRVCKPGSVLTAIYLDLPLLAGSSRLPGTVGQTICSSTALLQDRVYIVKPMLPWAGWALTPPFQPYCPACGVSGISLLHLSWGRPRRVLPVIPCPVKPGLSSSAAFRLASAAVRPGRENIVAHERRLVKHLAKSFSHGILLYIAFEMRSFHGYCL